MSLEELWVGLTVHKQEFPFTLVSGGPRGQGQIQPLFLRAATLA